MKPVHANPQKYPDITRMRGQCASSIKRVLAASRDMDEDDAEKLIITKFPDIIFSAMFSAATFGYMEALGHYGSTGSSSDKKKLEKFCKDDAQKVSKQMSVSTINMIGETELMAGNKKFAYSKERAQRAADYQVWKAFSNGTLTGWSRGVEVLKGWQTIGDCCDVCADNEDDGFIPLDEVFSSGDLFTPNHLSCNCYMISSRRK